MFFVRRYHFYKRLIYGFVLINVALMCLGLAAAVRYFQENQAHNGEVALIGLGVLIFGVLLPLYAFKKIEERYHEWEQAMKKTISEWLVAWIEAQRTHDSSKEIFRDPTFWLNMALIGMDAMQGHVKNPYFQYFSEIASFVRDVLRQERHREAAARKARRNSK